MFVFEEAGVVRGFVELKEGRHVAMLFVAPGFQRGGIGGLLLAEALQHARVAEVTVGSSLNAVPAICVTALFQPAWSRSTRALSISR